MTDDEQKRVDAAVDLHHLFLDACDLIFPLIEDADQQAEIVQSAFAMAIVTTIANHYEPRDWPAAMTNFKKALDLHLKSSWLQTLNINRRGETRQ